jgi:hypothetical protein
VSPVPTPTWPIGMRSRLGTQEVAVACKGISGTITPMLPDGLRVHVKPPGDASLNNARCNEAFVCAPGQKLLVAISPDCGL